MPHKGQKQRGLIKLGNRKLMKIKKWRQKKERFFATAEKRRKAMRKYLLLVGTALLGLSGSAYAAINCATPPTCSELGYTDNSSKCPDNNVKCPMDTSKVKCLRPYGKFGNCYYSDGHVGACKNYGTLVGMVMLSKGVRGGGDVGFVRWVLLPVKDTGTWYEARQACAREGGVIAPLGYTMYSDEVNTFFTNIGKGGNWSSTTTFWGEERSADKAWRYKGSIGQTVSKTESHMYFCMKSI